MSCAVEEVMEVASICRRTSEVGTRGAVETLEKDIGPAGMKGSEQLARCGGLLHEATRAAEASARLREEDMESVLSRIKQHVRGAAARLGEAEATMAASAGRGADAVAALEEELTLLREGGREYSKQIKANHERKIKEALLGGTT